MSKPILFTVHDIRFEAKRFSKEHDEPKQPIDILDLFKNIANFKVDEYSYPLHDNTLISKLRLIEVDIKKRLISMLITVSDIKARNRSYTDSRTGNTRLTNKSKTEGDDARIHIIIYLADDNLTGKMAIERERGSRISANLLRVLIDRCFEYIYENNSSDSNIIKLFSEDHPSGYKEDDGSFKRLPKKIKCKIENVFSDEILKAFKQGKISDLELIHTHQVTKTDHHSSFISTSSSFHFEVDPLVIPDNIKAPEAIQKTLVQKLTDLWNNTFQSSVPIPLDQHKYRIKYKDDYGQIATYTYTPAESLDMALAKTIKVDHRSFTYLEWKERPEINSSLCLNVHMKLKALKDVKYE